MVEDGYILELIPMNANSTIIHNITIGNNCTIGAGSVIIKNILEKLESCWKPG